MKKNISLSILSLFLFVTFLHGQEETNDKTTSENRKIKIKRKGDNSVKPQKHVESSLLDEMEEENNDEQSNLFDFDKRFHIHKNKPEFKFEWSVNILQEVHYINNGDLRKLDETSDLSIRYTDDQVGLAFTSAKFDSLFTFPKERVGLELSWGFDGIWGHDQLQGYSNPGMRINRANIFWTFIKSNSLDSGMVLGRQFFSVGGIPNDYMQKDILDAVVVNTSMKNLFYLKLLLVDFYSGGGNFGSGTDNRWNDEFQFFTRDTKEVTAGFNGDVSSYRTGMVFSLKNFFMGSNMPALLRKVEFDPRVYAYYAMIRGNGGGADRSENSQIGNFSDNDWSAMFGGRVSANIPIPFIKKLSVYGDLAASIGNDVRRRGEPDVDNNGIAFGAGVSTQFELLSWLEPFGDAGFFFAQGSKYDKNGNPTSHGFVSFKGDEIGGLLLRRYWGVHPSAYVDDDGIDDRPFDPNKKSGTLMIHIGGGLELWKKLIARIDIWTMQDLSSSAVDFKNTNAINNPYKTQAEIEAQSKLGKAMGSEMDISVKYQANALLKFKATFGIFIPGNFYQQSIAESVSTFGGPKGGTQDADFVGASFRTELMF